MAGRLDFNKNPLLFIEIANEIIKIKPENHFIWFGNQNDTPLYLYCIALQKAYHLENKITWAGDLGIDFLSHFRQIDGLVLTSGFESFSMITLEAIALGKPVVTHHCGGVVEILEAGYPVLADNKLSSYVEMMLNIMNDADLCQKMVLEGEKRATHFNSETQAKIISNLINE
jgi:glycosyltransferase involved in cell wall biosynthesis